MPSKVKLFCLGYGESILKHSVLGFLYNIGFECVCCVRVIGFMFALIFQVVFSLHLVTLILHLQRNIKKLC